MLLSMYAHTNGSRCFSASLAVGGAAVVFSGIALLACRPEPQVPAPISAHRADAPAIEATPRGRLAETPDTALLESARALLGGGGGGRRSSCGPYPLYTDVADPRLIAVCGRLAGELDEIYSARYGIRPRGEPAAAIVLFARVEDYRTFARDGGVPLGYAGYTLAARGLAVFYAGEHRAGRAGPPLDDFVTTLAHELTHLVNRRALGVNLPPWLAEGLADGVGDTATPEGFQPLAGTSGVEAPARRLRQALASDRTGRPGGAPRYSLERLVALKRGEFDRGVVSFDYEQSALLVRFLLSERELASGFRGFLKDLAGGDAHHPEHLAAALGIDWAELDRRFTDWLQQTR